MPWYQFNRDILVPPPKHDFEVGQDVVHTPTGKFGVVAVLPSPSLPFGQDMSRCLHVDMEDGTRCSDEVSNWQHYPQES